MTYFSPLNVNNQWHVHFVKIQWKGNKNTKIIAQTRYCRYIYIENNKRIGKIPNIKRIRMDLGHLSAPDENKSE